MTNEQLAKMISFVDSKTKDAEFDFSGFLGGAAGGFVDPFQDLISQATNASFDPTIFQATLEAQKALLPKELQELMNADLEAHIAALEALGSPNGPEVPPNGDMPPDDTPPGDMPPGEMSLTP